MSKIIYSKDHKYIVEQLKSARIEAGFDQVEAAKLLGRTQPYISKMESGQRKIHVVTLKEFARVYKKPLYYFLK